MVIFNKHYKSNNLETFIKESKIKVKISIMNKWSSLKSKWTFLIEVSPQIDIYGVLLI